MHNLIPKPASITMSEGGFLLSSETKIVSGTEDAIRAIGILLAEYIEQHTKLNLTVVDAHQNLGNIHRAIKIIDFTASRIPYFTMYGDGL